MTRTEERRQYEREYYQKNKERIRLRNREWVKNNPQKVKAYKLKNRRGLTVEEYTNMLNAQRGLCAICNQPFQKHPRNGEVEMFCVDHNHETGAIRGLLCASCNTLLGFAKDDTDILGSAITYLKEYK